jgi:hypothetical protein
VGNGGALHTCRVDWRLRQLLFFVSALITLICQGSTEVIKYYLSTAHVDERKLCPEVKKQKLARPYRRNVTKERCN